jgi:hypothetical protein
MSNVTPIPVRGVTSRRGKPLSFRAQMVLGYISEQAYWRAIDRANGGRVIPFVKPPAPAVRP